MSTITITHTNNPSVPPSPGEALGFGRRFTDHMFIWNYQQGKGWTDPRIMPYSPLALDPSAMVFHYGQAIFEGMKAYRWDDGGIHLFRPHLNFERMNRSAERMDIPQFDADTALEGLRTLLRVDEAFVPADPGTSLYIRPFIIATEASLGVHSAEEFMFVIICSPSGAYYSQGLAPVPILVEDRYVRAVRGGTGEAKTAGNYAASIKAQMAAKDKGYVQVLWLDGIERKYIEEVGAMNVFFVVDDAIYTPPLSGTILPGITRRSAIELLRSQGREVIETPIALEWLLEQASEGRLTEAFGTGTAAVISPIGQLYADGSTYRINNNETGPVAQALYGDLTGIQTGMKEDTLGWTEQI